MIILMKKNATQEHVDRVVAVLKEHGLGANVSPGNAGHGCGHFR